jgi:hypothetical protein
MMATANKTTARETLTFDRRADAIGRLGERETGGDIVRCMDIVQCMDIVRCMTFCRLLIQAIEDPKLAQRSAAPLSYAGMIRIRFRGFVAAATSQAEATPKGWSEL